MRASPLRGVGAVLALLAACNGVAGLDDLAFHDEPEGGTDEPCTPGDTRSCYNGPAKTEGVGLCKAGLATCRATGDGYEPCVGETLPAAEDCGTDADESCDGTPNEGCPCEPGATMPCYSGPAGTEGIGACHGGTQVCLEGGASYGPCQDEVLPTSEVCSTAEDEDCDAVPECGDVLSAGAFGTVGPQTILGLGVNAAGEVAVAGELEGLFSLDGNVVSGASPGDAFGALRGSNGLFVWAEAYGDVSMEDHASDAAMGPGASVLLGGGVKGPVDFGTGTLTPQGFPGALEGFVARVGGSQNAPWATLLGDAADQVVHAVAAGPAGEVFVVGDNAGTITLGMKDLIATNTDGYLIAWDAAGVPLYAYGFGGNKLQRALDVAVDGVGRAVVAGYAQEELVTDDFVLGIVGGTSMAFVFALDVNGTYRWMQNDKIGGATSTGTSVAVGPGGEVYFGGNFQGDFAMDVCGLNTATGDDGFLVALSSAGDCQFAYAIGGSGDQTVTGVAVDVSGNVFVTGSFKGNTDFGDGNVLSPTSWDGYVLKLDALGLFQWVRVLGGAGAAYPNDLVWSPLGRVVVGGAFDGDLDWGTGTLSSAGDLDAFLLDLTP